MATLFYNLFLSAYSAAFRAASLFNNKARLGVAGRKDIFTKIRSNPPTRNRQLVWMHCASLGEFEQGRPVIELLKKEYPQILIVLTFFSASGYEVMKNYKGADHIFYLPMDNSANARKLVATLAPSLVLWIKYEFWYHYLHELKERGIPVLLVSGIFRDSQPFFKWYGGIWRQMLGCFRYFFVQNELSRDLLATVGIHENIIISGDTRFDRVIEVAENFVPLPLIEKFCSNSKVLVAGSTWDDDEAELVHFVRANPTIKFIIAPHETDGGNIKDVKKQFPNSVFYSELAKGSELIGNEAATVVPGSVNVLIIDNVGMLSRLYYYADIAYVGGGFGADGVHNVLEPAVFGKPVIYGPEYEKFSEAIELVEAGGSISIKNALELENALEQLWDDPHLLKFTGDIARNYVYTSAGASHAILQFIQEKRLLTN